jgi:hypothetical protein
MLADRIQPHRIRIRPAPSPTAAHDPAAAPDNESSIADCLEHLSRFPEDDEARERLAHLYAHHDGHMGRAPT